MCTTEPSYTHTNHTKAIKATLRAGELDVRINTIAVNPVLLLILLKRKCRYDILLQHKPCIHYMHKLQAYTMHTCMAKEVLKSVHSCNAAFHKRMRSYSAWLISS